MGQHRIQRDVLVGFIEGRLKYRRMDDIVQTDEVARSSMAFSGVWILFDWISVIVRFV
jgi:hypothetical protein